MRAFLDTSSLIKLYHLEAGSLALRAQLPDNVEVIVTQLTWVESTSAFGRIVRRGTLTQALAHAALQDLQTDWRQFTVLAIDQATYQLAAQRVQQHAALALRSLDAIQLAAALAAGPLNAFFTHDQRLRDAATAEGLPVR